VSPKQRLILALDVDNAREAEALVRVLGPEVGWFKVGLELFVSEGPGIIERLRRAGARGIMLDLKLHDIPATMRAAAKAASRLGVGMLTCHCDQPGIFQGLELGETKLLGVSVLTSLDRGDLAAMGYRRELTDPPALVLHRARLAMAAGCHGVVCSGREARTVREALGPEAIIVCPGIRMPGPRPKDDQKRVVDPATAIAAGADYIVVGRPIRLAPDPVRAAREVVGAIASVRG